MGGQRMTSEERAQLLEMRSKGFSIGEIARTLKRGRSTISGYVSGVPILPEYYQQWVSKRGGNAQRSAMRRQASEVLVSKLLGRMTKRDRLLIAACLYWGEGNKREFGFTNTDPTLIETFVNCLTAVGLKRDRLRITLRLYEDINEEEARRYWAKVIGIKPNKILGVNVLKGKKIGKLKYGMCRLRITKGSDYFNLMFAAIEFMCKNLALVAQRTEQWTPKP